MSKRKISVCCHGRINKNSAFQVFGKTLLLIRCTEMRLFSQKTQAVRGFGILFPSETVRWRKTVTVVPEKGQQPEGRKEQEEAGRSGWRKANKPSERLLLAGTVPSALRTFTPG